MHDWLKSHINFAEKVWLCLYFFCKSSYNENGIIGWGGTAVLKRNELNFVCKCRVGELGVKISEM